MPAAEPSLTVADVDGALDRLAATTGAGSVGARNAVLAGLFGRATEAEDGFLRLALTGGLRQGALEGVMADAVAKAAASRRRTCGGRPCWPATWATSPPSPSPAEAGRRRGAGRHRAAAPAPVQPMLAATSPDVGAALEATGLASVEWKLDGARIQVHRDGDEVRIFTRNLNDVTDRLPGVAAVVRTLPAGSLVLDGEAMGLDEDGGAPAASRRR